MKKNLKEAMKTRRSVRTFNNQPVTDNDLIKVDNIILNINNPFGIPVELSVLDAKKKNLSTPVIVGEDLYIVSKITPEENWELGYGYAIEELCLLLEEMGIGTTLIGGTFNRKLFEDAMELNGNEIMPLVTPIGYPDQNMSDREKQMRNAIKADNRLPFETLFFSENFDTPLKKEEAGVFAEALDLLRLAPSAVNNQPWRALLDNDTIHFYKNKEKRLSEGAPWDVQKIDIGIGLANFDLTLKENGINGEFFFTKPAIAKPEELEYMVSYKLNN